MWVIISLGTGPVGCLGKGGITTGTGIGIVTGSWLFWDVVWDDVFFDCEDAEDFVGFEAGYEN